MKWYHYIAYFFGGAFLVNFVPHFTNGVSGPIVSAESVLLRRRAKGSLQPGSMCCGDFLIC